jgi:hypothetical protein
MTARVLGALSKAGDTVDPGGLGRFVRMAGSSIAGRDAAAWVTHFLNACYYGVPRGSRDLENLRIAWGVLTTYWHQLGGGPLRAYHLRRFHHSFRAARSTGGSRYPRGLLDRDQLVDGAAQLVGPWFNEARSDPGRIGWGVVFQTSADHDLYVPEVRLRRTRLRPISPPAAPPSEQTWHTYQQVPIPGVDDLVAVLEATETWSHFATDVGRFTALRSGPLRGQTFEIEVIAELARHLPMLTRGYVTVTQVLDRSQPAALQDQVAILAANVARRGPDAPEVLPATGNPTHLVELTTHTGHFLGRARNYLLVFETGDGAYVRTIGNWDPMPWYVRLSYAYEGADAQRTFWGLESPEHSMLRQFARAAARRQRARGQTPRIPAELESASQKDHDDDHQRRRR